MDCSHGLAMDFGHGLPSWVMDWSRNSVGHELVMYWSWTACSNRLKLNPSKTELILLRSSRQLEHCPVGEAHYIAGVIPLEPAIHVHDLGFLHLTMHLTLKGHINHVDTNLLLPFASTESSPALPHDRHG